jgi:hypothetical protein
VRHTTLLLAFLTASGAALAGGAGTKRVSGRVEQVSSVCGGGAAIRQEQIDALPPPAPIPGKEFLVVAGDRITAARPAARFTSRPDGTFTTRLPPGTWCFFEAGRRPREDQAVAPGSLPAPPKAGIDAGCLENEKRRCDLVLPVKSDVRDARITFTTRCSEPWAQPCYRGPMPP